MAMRKPPTTAESMTRHEAMPQMSRMAAPMRMQKVEVSPQEPGMKPQKASERVSFSPMALVRSVRLPVEEASWPSGVAPVKPSTAGWPPSDTNTLSPLILAG